MQSDIKLFKWVGVLLLLPLLLAFFGHDQFRYPCQDPENWNKPFCQKPACDVTRTCPEHIFKGQKDPRTLTDEIKPIVGQTPTQSTPPKGENCGK